jgi:hypothetical protein
VNSSIIRSRPLLWRISVIGVDHHFMFHFNRNRFFVLFCRMWHSEFSITLLPVVKHAHVKYPYHDQEHGIRWMNGSSCEWLNKRQSRNLLFISNDLHSNSVSRTHRSAQASTVMFLIVIGILDRDRMVVGFITICTISAYDH